MNLSFFRRVAAVILLCVVAGASIADPAGSNHAKSLYTVSDVIGFPGGSARDLICPDDAPYMVGVDGRFGDWIDALAPTCVGYNAYGRWDRTVALVGASAGGSGGHPDTLACPMGTHIDRFLAEAFTSRMDEDHPSHLYDIGFSCGVGYPEINWIPYTGSYAQKELTCAAGYIAHGIRVFADDYIYSLALICSPIPPSPKLLGRIGTSHVDPTMSICDAAKSARARNSMAAPDLEKQCQASKPPPLALGKVHSTDISITPQASMTMCEAARSAKARNSRAAPDLERQCLAGGGSMSPIDAAQMDALANIGATIAAQDPDLELVRSSNPAADYQHGFDIATGIFGNPALGAQGNTSTGPGSIGIRASLNASGQLGFDAALKLHLTRNYKQ